MIESNFKDWTLTKLDDAFGMRQIWDGDLMKKWMELSKTFKITDFEEKIILKFQKPLIKGGRAWNEVELENKFISPLILASDIEEDGQLTISYFLERRLEGIVGDYKLMGIVDGMVATGFRDPNIPFFCMHEYKRSIENTGTPDAQALAAMMVAREMNENEKPIYGMYIVGLIWNFMVLEGNEYCISKNYDSSTEGVFEIFKMLKALKHIIKTELM